MVLDTEKRPRKSWVVWREQGKYPDVIVEILSDSTANIDRNNKKILYQNTFRTPNYFWFDPNSLELQGFRLIEGQYQAISPNDQGYLWSEQLGLYLGILLKLVTLLNTEVIKQIVININNKDWYNAKKLWILNVLKVKINRTIIDLWQIIIYIIKYLF